MARIHLGSRNHGLNHLGSRTNGPTPPRLFLRPGELSTLQYGTAEADAIVRLMAASERLRVTQSTQVIRDRRWQSATAAQTGGGA